MPEIIPAILVKTFEEFRQKVEAVEDYAKWVQLDVADGDFAPSKTWGDPDQLRYYDPGVFIEAHLMVAKPEKVIDKWIKSGVKRIYFHYESTSKHEEIIKKLQDNKIEAGVALLPETPLSNIKLFDELLDAVLLFAGDLGHYGGEFKEDVTLEKISTLRQMHPGLIIEIDGGMNPETAPKAVDAGANAIVAGSYIFKNENHKKAIEDLKNSVK